MIDAITVDLPVCQKAVIHGDSLSFSIAAASILAKVARDAALERLGPTTLHRFSFEPVRCACHSQDYLWTGYPEQSELFACP